MFSAEKEPKLDMNIRVRLKELKKGHVQGPYTFYLYSTSVKLPAGVGENTLLITNVTSQKTCSTYYKGHL